MYPNLKIEIFKLGIHQNHLAREVGIADTVLSKIIHGYREPTLEQRKKIAQYLNIDEAWLFEKFSNTDATPVSGPFALQRNEK